jgi:Flp pilus assembly protein TadB
MAEHAEQNPSLHEQARALKEDWAPGRLEDTLEEAVSDRPMVKHLLDFGLILRAVAIAALVTLVLLLVASAAIAAIGLVVVFFGSWLLLARLSYDQRRETRDAGDDGDAEPDAA